MKSLLITICLMLALLVSGCIAPVYLFQRGKTLKECRKDSRECTTEANRNSYPTGALPLYYQCMEDRGYLKLRKEQLAPGTKVRQIDTIGLLFLAGE